MPRFVLALALALAPLPFVMGSPLALAAPVTGFAALTPGRVVHGFRPVARFQDATGTAMGARLVHVKSGFTLDLLRIQSVPQAFLWVDSWPVSDRGEPHTQEHLLLGKGNRGRAIATLDGTSLAQSSAYTEQRRTCYQFSTSAGPDTFYNLLERRLDALLHPDYTDEEVRREVRNFGVAAGPGGLRLEEQGTVYNEMAATYEKPWTAAYREIARALYGPTHPLAYDNGGTPAALRTLTPAHIRAFHAKNYHLGHMGLIAALPDAMPPDAALAQLDGLLDRVEPDAPRWRGKAPALPAPRGAKPGTIAVVGYPDENAGNPGQLLFAWPATLSFANPRERMLADLFASAFAGDATTTLYKRFIDSATRTEDIGATGVSATSDDDMGHPFRVAFGDVKAAHLTPAGVARIRRGVQDELAAIAAWPDGSPELLAFRARTQAIVATWRGAYAKFASSPPGFGVRGGSSAWMQSLDVLAAMPGFDHRITRDDDLAAAERVLASDHNVWRERLAAWHLTDTTPYAVAVKPDAGMAALEAKARARRLANETRWLMKRYGVSTEQAALKRYQADFARRTRTLDQLARSGPAPRFLANPPLERDPGLRTRVDTSLGVPLVATTFDQMAGATAGLALRLDGIAQHDLLYLALLPTLLTEVGVIVDGQPVAHGEVTRRLQSDALALDAYFTGNPRTRRRELVVRGTVNNRADAARAVAWMRHAATEPDWRPENLARLRDVVDQAALSLRQQMKGTEESWVDDPAAAFRWQDDPLYLATESFLTTAHLAHRLRWQLRDGGKDFAGFMGQLANAQGDRAALAAALAATPAERAAVPQAFAHFVAALDALPAPDRALARLAAGDLALDLPDLPAATAAGDWADLCRQIRDDAAVGSANTLRRLDAVRRQVFAKGRARLFLIGPRPRQDALVAKPLPDLLASLDPRPVALPALDPHPRRPATDGFVTARLRSRIPGATPTYVGLVNPNTQGGVFVHAAPAASYHDTSGRALTDLLAAQLYGGGGAHSIFMKTWGAGLAYSNGLSAGAAGAAVHYYAERCPALPQTMAFVVGEIKKAKPDPTLVEYAFAQLFNDPRAAASYESRGESAASDLADGVPPEVVRRHRRALLALRGRPGLAADLFKRMPAVYGQVLPGLGQGATPGATYMAIGPEAQLAGYEQHLRQVVGPTTTLYRLYPRDFWLP